MLSLNNIIDKIVVEEMQRLITERLSDRLFHFCPISACYNIIMSNSLILSSAAKNSNDKRMNSFKRGDGTIKTYEYYMCFSRTFSTADGYVRTRRENSPEWRKATVRIEFDGELLNRYFYGKPVNAFFDYDKSSDKLNQGGKYYSIPNAPGLLTMKKFNNLDDSLLYSTSYEHEDRLFSNERVIKNANTFIKEIDILLDPDIFIHSENYSNIFSLLGAIRRNHKFSNLIRIYNNEKAFNSLNVRDSKGLKELTTSLGYKKRREYGTNYSYVNDLEFRKKYSDRLKTNVEETVKISKTILGHLAVILGVIAYNRKNCNGEYVNDALGLAKKCGLGEYLGIIKERIPDFSDWGIKRFNMTSQMYNGTIRDLSLSFPNIAQKIENLKASQEEIMGYKLFYGKGLLHKTIYGF